MSKEGGDLIVKVSAPGKVILHGEHSVVYGKLAIAASLDLRTNVTLEETRNDQLEIVFEDLKFKKNYQTEHLKSILPKEIIPIANAPTAKYSWTHPDVIDHDKYVTFITSALKVDEEVHDKNVQHSILAFFYLYVGILLANNVPTVPMKIIVKSDLTLGAGTGSSASFMVSLAGAFVRYLTAKMPNYNIQVQDSKVSDNFTVSELNLISQWAYCAEKIIHGNPSGIDNTICTFGSMVSFRKGSEPSNIKSSCDIRGLLVDTRVPKNTGVMVKRVADLKERHPKVIDAVLESMDELTSEAMEYLLCLGMLDKHGSMNDVENCYTNLNELADVNHNLLCSLGVSHSALDDVIKILKSNDLHGKITGSGGGGYIICLIPPHIQFRELDSLCSELSSKGYNPLLTHLGGVGLTVDI